jgi:hypothetical protein
LRKDPGRWHVFGKTQQRIDFLPASWYSLLPELSALPNGERRGWIFWWVSAYQYQESVRLVIEIGPCKVETVRSNLIERLTRDPEEFGFRTKKKITPTWTRLLSATVSEGAEGGELDKSKAMSLVAKELDELERRLAGVPNVLAEVFAEHNKPT